MSETTEDPVARTAAMFDVIAPRYDQSGVPFFGTIAGGLVDLLAPQPGERALDVGSGRGAVTLRLADAVGPQGRVDAIDISPGMVELLTAETGHLPQVRVAVGDATDPALEAASYDLVASSLVLFFLPDPVAALARWSRLLVPGGRLGAATFRPWPATWQSIEDLFDEYAQTGPGPGPTTMPDVYADDAAVEGLFREAGLVDVRTEVATYAVPFADVEQWRVWSLGTAMRGLWARVPEEAGPEIVARVARILEDAGGSMDVEVRYTLAGAPRS
jgi:ubiquinone/menaquinone biosynthesis C-methylase UbiE